MAKVMIEGWQCERCGHRWVPREGMNHPARCCPKCKSPFWDRPRRTPKAKADAKKSKKG
jgi:predicted Zn-ribbon and HTH transcriptional regulator